MITDFLTTGAQNAKTGRELARLLHCDIREVTRDIEAARRKGSPIIVNCSKETPGYYLAETAGEVEHYCRRLHKRAGELHKTRRALLKVADEMTEQEPQQ